MGGKDTYREDRIQDLIIGSLERVAQARDLDRLAHHLMLALEMVEPVCQQRVHVDQRGTENDGAAFEGQDALVIVEGERHSRSGEFDGGE